MRAKLLQRHTYCFAGAALYEPLHDYGISTWNYLEQPFHPVFYSSWYRKGVTKIHHLLNERGNFLSRKYGLSVNFLTYNGLLAAISDKRKKSILNSEPLDNSEEHRTSEKVTAQTARKMLTLCWERLKLMCKWRMIIAVNFPIEGTGKKKSEKIRTSTAFEPVTSAKYRCDALLTELWSHTLKARSIYWVHISREEWNDVKYIRNNSYLNCACRWKWRMIITVNFPI